MNHDEVKIFYEAAEYNFNAACEAYKQAAANLKRSKSEKNRIAMVVAEDHHALCAKVMREAESRLARIATVERRKALLAPRMALRQAQGVLL